MVRCFAKVSEEEIKTAYFYPSDLDNCIIYLHLIIVQVIEKCVFV